LVRHRVALANQLRATLERFWPGAAAIFADVDTPIALDFLQRYPTPESASSLGPKRLAGFLARHAYCGRRPPEELLERLRAAPTGLVEAAEQEAQGLVVLAFVAALRPIVRQIKLLTAAIEHDVAQLPTGQILMSFPRAGRLNAAQILAELGEDLSRFVDEDHLAAEAGVVPVTYASGKHRHVGSRFACNKRLRRAVTTWADNSRHASPWARSVYDQARARGCRHTHAVRILARAWLRVLWRCLSTHHTYDPAHHNAAARLAQAA
jgi:transposase